MIRNHKKARMIGAAAIAVSLALTTAACSRDAAPAAPVAEAGDIVTGPGFDGKTIKLGVLGVTSGPLAEPSSTILDGIRAYFEALNAEGGVAGEYPVELVVRDTAYDPAKVIQEYNSSKDDVLAYAQIFGTAMVNAILPDLNAEGIVSLPSSADGKLLHEPSIMLTTAPAEIDLINGVEYLTEKEGLDTRVCYIAMEGALGESSKAAVQWAADEIGFNMGITATVPVEGDYTPQIQELRRDNCEIVVTKGSGVVLTGLLSKAVQVGFAPTWLAPSTDWIPSMRDFPEPEYLKQNLVLVKDATIYGDETAEGMEGLVAAHDKYTPDTTPVWLYTNGYSSALVLTQVIERAIENGDLSRAGMMTAFNSLDELDYKGLQGNMPWGSPEDRSASSDYSILSIDVTTTTGQVLVESNIKGEASKGYSFNAS
jgi:ABC-type branched-subunit amino acid transport system substrate-binding protein